ncbi:substrate-binding domain-containing protein [Pelagibius sp. CAU 1746]|uniref:substrate-binding domain-containing protein n=1 Tax=Pelagibius sp. CAU 1746 TaxID=3140370 RepID=UPI00325B5B6D
MTQRMIRRPAARFFCAGSLSKALGQAIADHAACGPAPEGSAIELVSGPAGLLCGRIEAGDAAEIFLSASPEAPHRLAAAGGYAPPHLLCHNRLAVVARPGLTLEDDSLLDRLLDPDLRLVCSTPGCDPGGDYAMALFEALERLRPGATALLKAKASHPFGGPDNSAPVDGMSPAVVALRRGIADLMVVYRTTARAACAAVPGATAVVVPPDWLPRTEATLTWRRDAGTVALSFVDYLKSPRAARLLEAAGLEPAGQPS